MGYIGILDGSGDVWGVTVLAVPGCQGGGATPGEAIVDAARALRARRDAGEVLPRPASAADVEMGYGRGKRLLVVPSP